LASKIPFIYLEYRAYCHATEDEEKVLCALKNALGEIKTERRFVTGYHGNPVVLLRGKLGTRKAIVEFFRRLKANDLKRIISELEQRIDENFMIHIRVDKQAAYEGHLEILNKIDAIDIAIKIESFPASYERALKIATEFLMNVLESKATNQDQHS